RDLGEHRSRGRHTRRFRASQLKYERLAYWKGDRNSLAEIGWKKPSLTLLTGWLELCAEEGRSGEHVINRGVREPIDISRLEKAVEEVVPEAGGRNQNRSDKDCVKWVSL
ncbi:MAG: hypothetical protein P8182_09425, partial [Deltaproteobacteria bacterium]